MAKASFQLSRDPDPVASIPFAGNNDRRMAHAANEPARLPLPRALDRWTARRRTPARDVQGGNAARPGIYKMYEECLCDPIAHTGSGE
jgi:hypothetical protein